MQTEALTSVCDAVVVKKEQMAEKINLSTATWDRLNLQMKKLPPADRCNWSLLAKAYELRAKVGYLAALLTATSFTAKQPAHEKKKVLDLKKALAGGNKNWFIQKGVPKSWKRRFTNENMWFLMRAINEGHSRKTPGVKEEIWIAFPGFVSDKTRVSIPHFGSNGREACGRGERTGVLPTAHRNIQHLRDGFFTVKTLKHC